MLSKISLSNFIDKSEDTWPIIVITNDEDTFSVNN